jgi:hypothetical protein
MPSSKRKPTLSEDISDAKPSKQPRITSGRRKGKAKQQPEELISEWPEYFHSVSLLYCTAFVSLNFVKLFKVILGYTYYAELNVLKFSSFRIARFTR